MPRHMPYHFLPTPGVPHGLSVPLEIEAMRNWGDLGALHEAYSPGALTGRILVKVTCKSPLVVGQLHLGAPNGAKTIQAYRIGDKPVIPGSTLKGLISSTVEAASASTLRILSEAYWKDFEKVDPNLLPMNRHRTRLSLAELLFGYVGDGEVPDHAPIALAGRVAVSPAFPRGTIKLDRKPLAASFGPRPHEAKHYHDTAGFPNGRKQYVLHREDSTAWQGRNVQAKFARSAEMVPKKSEFIFHVDFHQLAPTWLDLLVYGISPKSGGLHRLGLGKPLGLGEIKMDPLFLGLVDRHQRYSPTGLAQLRYHQVWTTNAGNFTAESIDAEVYPDERKAAGDDRLRTDPEAWSVSACRKRWENVMTAHDLDTISKRLGLLMDRSNTAFGIGYPQAAGERVVFGDELPRHER